jgi:membrane protein implicated in regulation of membrane protease activity
MSQAGKLFGGLAILLLVLFLLPLILVMAFFASAPAQSPLPTDLFLIFWGYRWFDLLFLAVAIFAAMVGVSSLFRAEKAEVPIEETVTEGYVEEEIEEE